MQWMFHVHMVSRLDHSGVVLVLAESPLPVKGHSVPVPDAR